MTEDICQRLLHHPEKSRCRVRINRNLFHVAVEFGPNAGPLLKVRELPLDGRNESEIIKDGWTQFRSDRADALNGLVDLLDHTLQLFASLAFRRRRPFT